MKKEKFIKLVIVNSMLFLLILTVISFAVFFVDGGMKNLNKSRTGLPSASPSPSPVLPKQKEVALPKVLYNLSGKITKLDNNAIIFNAEIISLNSNKEIVKTIESRKALVGSSAKFSRLSFVNNSPIETKIELKDFKEGDYIEAISSKDISKAAEFTATQVRILP